MFTVYKHLSDGVLGTGPLRAGGQMAAGRAHANSVAHQQTLTFLQVTRYAVFKLRIKVRFQLSFELLICLENMNLFQFDRIGQNGPLIRVE